MLARGRAAVRSNAMARTLRKIEHGLFPRGVRDAALQVSLFAACYLGYQFVRGHVDGAAATAFWNATKVIQLEHTLNIFVEPSVQAWSRGNGFVIGFADWMYINSHYLITFGSLAFIYMRRNSSFYFVRNMFVAAMGLALIAYALYPTAPPRLMPEWGFSDTIAAATGVRVDNEHASALLNLYAAVPSMHVCFALMVGGSMSALTSRVWARRVWRLYPLLVSWVVLATGNHYLLDVILGGVTALVAWLIARRLGRVRDGWRFAAQGVVPTGTSSKIAAEPSEALT